MMSDVISFVLTEGKKSFTASPSDIESPVDSNTPTEV